MDLRWLKPRHIDLAGAAVCAILVGLGYVAGIRPLLVHRSDTAEENTRLATQRREGAELADTIAALKDQLAGIERDLAESTVRLAPAHQVNRRIARMADLAADCGVKIDEIQTGNPVAGARYQTIPIRLVGQKSYPACVTLLRRFREAFPDTAVASFELSRNPADPASPAKFQIDLLWYASIKPSPEKQ